MSFNEYIRKCGQPPPSPPQPSQPSPYVAMDQNITIVIIPCEEKGKRRKKEMKKGGKGREGVTISEMKWLGRGKTAKKRYQGRI